MILRKPYAFFIKYFRIINLIMAVLMGFLVYSTYNIVKFLNDYTNDYSSAVINFSLSNIINFYLFIIVLIIIIGNIVVLSVLFVKNKPKKLYIFNLILYILLLILLFVDYSSLRDITNTIMDVRFAKALRDVTIIALIGQVISLIITLVRATGFDVKQFDFAKDLQELNIDAKDNEEFEVAVELDSNKTKRNIRKNIRELKYFYKEHQFIIKMSTLIIIAIIIFMVAYNNIIYTSNYSQNKTFSASGVNLNVTSSYIVQTDENGNQISNGKSLVVVKFEVASFSQDPNAQLNTGLFNLRIDKNSYGQTKEYNSKIEDMGTNYINQELTGDFTSYILAFEVPTENVKKTMYLKFNDNVSYVRGEVGAKNIFVKLKPIDLTDIKNQEYNLGEKIDFTNSILENSKLKINSFEISNKFKSEYNFCATKTNCYKSYEYITPTATGNYQKTVLKLSGEYEKDENTNMDGLENIYYLLNQYGYIYYKIDGKWYDHKINSKNLKQQITTNDNFTYIEVNKDVEKASNIYLKLKVRNYTYDYTLK